MQVIDIPVKILKENELRLYLLVFNETISPFEFSWNCANITLVFKKGSWNLKVNYRPVSILPLIFEKLRNK